MGDSAEIDREVRGGRLMWGYKIKDASGGWGRGTTCIYALRW